ncbi:septum formation initiator family protein [Acidisphaera sp. L21]|jgi:cell division protein FtsB|uniref:FtsB family cell division protein n=1 Tax=Acidisphaera sp. L21 TaxID=1641851 RepID=UPI00131E738B|nr:septum formation initiator family protein [Acidisphaera sp. L21]
MSIGRAIKRRTKAAIPSVVLLAIAAYFGWSATQGDRGLQAYAHQQDQLRLAQLDLSRTNTDVDVWERRVSALRSTRLDPDALDERARAMLNLADPTDIVVMYGQGKKLF